jgi:hypothetical protein
VRRVHGRRAARGIVGVIVVGLTAAALSWVAAPRASATDGWCGGTDEKAVDRPDAVGGPQIHVVYARTSDSPDRFADLAPAIARDLNGIDAWWRGQDSSRAPRFDLANFPGCDGSLSAVDLSSVTLSLTEAQTAALSVHDLPRQVGLAVADAIHQPDIVQQTAFGDKYFLVYLDAAIDIPELCGITPAGGQGSSFDALVLLRNSSADCQFGEIGTGDGVPAATAAHELVHLLDEGARTERPHSCPDDAPHMCDSDTDLMYPRGNGTGLSAHTLDVGHDDYYALAPGSTGFDVRTSPLLRKLDGAQAQVVLDVTGPGVVTGSGDGLLCPSACSLPFDAGAVIELSAVPADNSMVAAWGGACSNVTASTTCAFTAQADSTVKVRFAKIVPVQVKVQGPGQVEVVSKPGVDGGPCTDSCDWSMGKSMRQRLVAVPRSGAHFVGWETRPCSQRGNKATCSITPNAPMRVVARFTR